MKVTNEGQTFVFDSKTKEAIEAGKNKITLLAVEELRLKKLKGSLESEIIKLEADIKYKEDRVVELGNVLKETEKEVASLRDVLAELEEVHRFALEKLKNREEAVQAQETTLHEKELALNAKQAQLNDLIERTSKDFSIAEKSKDIADEKIKKIDEFLKSL
jgi:chromosome segregation ATPase